MNKPVVKGFTFEKDLPHQKRGVDSVLALFEGVEPTFDSNPSVRLLANPELNLSKQQFLLNIKTIQDFNEIEHTTAFYNENSNVIDVSMETGTGKTYTYTKTMFELNKSFGINKFIIIVPTLSIKAGTVNFLKSEALKDHFKETEREIKTYVVESKASKSKKSYMPQAINDFVEANNFNKKYIHVMIINLGMVNSKTLSEVYDRGLLDNQYNTPIDAVSATKPFIILDEPHKFPRDKKTWTNIEKFNAQRIIRYGATFGDDYENLVYRLTAIDAFNNELVKGVNVFIEGIDGEDKATITLKDITKTEATFELNQNDVKKTFKLAKGEHLSIIHPEIQGLYVEQLAVQKKFVLLSNGIELKKGKSISPYSYSDTLEDNMMRRAIKEHFKIEKQMLTQKPRIKPLTLFFIDDIEGYREGNNITGSLKSKFEELTLAEAKSLLKNETDEFYKSYLEKTIADISNVHGGYFSKDNTSNDDKVEQEITEILHDKELLLSLDNPRRFIFSKWTLREGWDNPNIFTLCKLRSSGSTTSKLQEVGRGLRLPVNEYMARVNGQFSLNYFVDFTEDDFVKTLVDEVNTSSFKETIPSSLTAEIEAKILSKYDDIESLDLLMDLVSKGIIDKSKNFTSSNSYQQLKEEYPKAFPTGLNPDKIKFATEEKKRSKMRVGKFDDLKALWELINQKAILKYDIENEEEFLSLFTAYLFEETDKFKKTGVRTSMQKIFIDNNDIAMSKTIAVEDDDFTKFSTMSYKDFVNTLSQRALIKPSTLHKAFLAVQEKTDITEYLNIQTIRKITSGFSKFLLFNSFSKFGLGYQVISNSIHPTKFTNSKGEPLQDVSSSDLGVKSDLAQTPFDNYLFDDVFYDSELERINITEGEEIEFVTVFTKIPKNSIKIPVAGGFSYSPDFAYVVKTNQGNYLNFIIETKNVDGKDDLRKEEEKKIEHAKILFNQISQDVSVEFKTQYAGDVIYDLIKEHITHN